MLSRVLAQSARAMGRTRGRVLGGAQAPNLQQGIHSTSSAEADSMGSLIDKGKDGAEYVVSGT